MNGIGRFFVNLSTRGRNRRWYAWLAPNLGLPRGAACLELGCGNADMARRIVEGTGAGRYTATDLDPRQLEAARKHLAKLYPDGAPAALDLREADMLALPFPDASFDAVFAFVSLHHADSTHGAWENVPKALGEVDRVLRPGGRFAYTEMINRDKVRAWLADHGYRVAASSARFMHEAVVAVKADGPAASASQA